MTTTNQNNTAEKIVTPAEKQTKISAHKTIATHLETAAKYHHEAANYHEEDNHEGAAKSAMTAHEHLMLANAAKKHEAAKEVVNIKK